MKDEGIRMKDYVFVYLLPPTLSLLCPTLPTQVKVKRWKGERVFLDEG